MDFDIDHIISIAENGICQALQQGSVTLVEHGYCWYCNTETEVYEASPEWPVQPPRCFECYVDAIAQIFDDPAQLASILKAAEEEPGNDPQ